MVEIPFEIFLPQAASSLQAAIIARSAPTGVVRLQVVRLGAVTLKASLRPSSICHSFSQARSFAGAWLAITAAQARAGALTRLMLAGAHRLRVIQGHLGLAQLGRHVRRRRQHQALMLHPHLLRTRDRAQSCLFGATVMGSHQLRSHVRHQPHAQCRRQHQALTLHPRLLRTRAQRRSPY